MFLNNFAWLACLGMVVLPASASAVLPFERTGNLYVSMWNADEIAVFSPDGVPLERFTAQGLDGPRGIAFNPLNGDIWVASEFGNAVFIFDHAHRFLRRLDHPDFDEPVGVTFSSTQGVDDAQQTVYISNSNRNEIMVFDLVGNLQRRFSGTALSDPNCSAFMQDGSFFVANRLGGSFDTTGAVSAFTASDDFVFDFTTDGIASVMAVARDVNSLPTDVDDTIWVTSGAGDSGIYEFDPSGNLLTSMLPAQIDDGRPVVPQGIAFDSKGSFYVVSYLNEVLKFDSDGRFINRFPTGTGTARSTAFQGCQPTEADACVPFGNSVNDGTLTTDASGGDGTQGQTTVSANGGGGFAGWLLIGLLAVLRQRRQNTSASNGCTSISNEANRNGPCNLRLAT